MRYNKEELGNKLRIARKAKNMNQGDVCKAIGIDQSTYSKLENGKYDIQLSILYSLSDCLEVSIQWLLDLDNEDGFTNKERSIINQFKNFIISTRKRK